MLEGWGVCEGGREQLGARLERRKERKRGKEEERVN